MPEGTAFIQAVIVVHAADGVSEASYGLDDVSLDLIYENQIQSANLNYLANPGFEEADQDSNGIPDGWIGYAQTGASIELINKNTTAYNGKYWTKCTSTSGGFYLLYQNTFPAKEGDIWDFSSFIKDVSPADPGGSYAALKITAKTSSGSNIQAWEVFQDSVTSYWKRFSNSQTMPEGTGYIQAVIVVHGADGAPEASYGFDDVKLELVSEVPDETNLLVNPGFEEGADSNSVPLGWLGYAQTGASIEFIRDAQTSHNGVNWVKCTSTQGGYYLLYQNTFPTKEGDVWKLSSFFKDVSPNDSGGYYAALKISAKSVTGSTFQSWEIYQDSVTKEWAEYSNTQTMPEGTAFIQAVIVIHAADGAPDASYGIDDVKLKLVAEKDPSNYLANPGFEAGVDSNGVPIGWIGYAQTGASMEVINDASTANSGDTWVKCTSTEGGYYLLYQNTFKAKEGDIWKLSSFYKDVSPSYPGANFAALKISAKSVTGATFQSWEIYPDSVTTEWEEYVNTQTMPEGTAYIQAVVVIHAADNAPEASYGIDDVKLELLPEVDTLNYLANPGFEGDIDANGIPTGWIGYSQTGASMEVIKDAATANSGYNWVKCTSTEGGYYLLYQNAFPAAEGDVWEFSAHFKDISPAYPGGHFAALKISAKSVTGSTFLYWEEFQDSVSSEWIKCSNIQTMPEGTAYIQAVLVIHGADGATEASYGIDDVRLVKEVSVGVENNTNTIPIDYSLNQNYPNPFNPSTIIKYSLKNPGKVSLKVFNVLGQEVATLVNEFKNTGNYEFNFNARNLASGVYVYRLQSGAFVDVKKMVLIK
ncbi:MAG: T9SS type A sorting domain-containing protein [Bacteroidetes bacterium]|nr:T9SS type A sorting domain-containing protein [Bacteroidota bacterium]